MKEDKYSSGDRKRSPWLLKSLFAWYAFNYRDHQARTKRVLSRLSISRERRERPSLNFVLLAVEVVTRRAKRVDSKISLGFSAIASSVSGKYIRRKV